MESTKPPSPESDRSPVYVRLINMMSAIRNMSAFNVLTADEERLLGDLVVLWHSRPLITISDLMGNDMSSSPSTTYRRLISLRDKGMITMRTDETDKRVKFVEPDSLARVYMERVRQSITSLIESEKTI